MSFKNAPQNKARGSNGFTCPDCGRRLRDAASAQKHYRSCSKGLVAQGHAAFAKRAAAKAAAAAKPAETQAKPRRSAVATRLDSTRAGVHPFRVSRAQLANPYTAAEVKARRREAIEDLAEVMARTPWSVTPATLADLCGVNRATIHKAVKAKRLTELRHKLPGGRELVLVSLREALEVFC